jgi:hypothetical protein
MKKIKNIIQGLELNIAQDKLIKQTLVINQKKAKIKLDGEVDIIGLEGQKVKLFQEKEDFKKNLVELVEAL